MSNLLIPKLSTSLNGFKYFDHSIGQSLICYKNYWCSTMIIIWHRVCFGEKQQHLYLELEKKKTDGLRTQVEKSQIRKGFTQVKNFLHGKSKGGTKKDRDSVYSNEGT